MCRPRDGARHTVTQWSVPNPRGQTLTALPCEAAVMDAVLKKLQHRPGTDLTVLAGPPELAPLIESWADDTPVRTRLGKNRPFVLQFVRSCAEIAERAPKAAAAVADDGVLWFAYPKRSSKRYRSDVGRDDSWQALGDLGFEPVRQVAIDEDWSALRFRRAEDITSLTRSRALSEAGRTRLARGAASPADPPEVTAWLEALDGPRADDVRTVHAAIRAAVPDLTPSVWGRMLGYGHYHYRYRSGREGDAAPVSLANGARYASLHLLGLTDDGRYVAEANAPRLGKVDVGKSCVRFRRAADLDLDVIAELARACAANPPSAQS